MKRAKYENESPLAIVYAVVVSGLCAAAFWMCVLGVTPQELFK